MVVFSACCVWSPYACASDLFCRNNYYKGQSQKSGSEVSIIPEKSRVTMYGWVSMKKNILKTFVVNILILSLIVYILGLTDSAFQQVYPSDNVVSYPINSLKYFILWVLPYWWLMIIIGAVLLTFIYSILRK